MTTTASLHNITDASIGRASHLTEVAEAIRDDALALARGKLSPRQRDLDLKSLSHHSAFLDYFKYGLASGVANVLAANDQHIMAIHAHDPSASTDSETGEDVLLDATVHLLVVVTSPSAALDALVAALDRALTGSLRSLPLPEFSKRGFVLDVNLITEEDVRLGVGYARLLSSVFMPPLQVWQREAEGG
jgi:hypothetical protein